MAFHVGQKVVCIDDRSSRGARWKDAFPQDAVIEGNIYTVRSVHIDAEGDEILRLYEVDRLYASKIARGDMMLGYGSYRFRPVVERKTDISIFIQILNVNPARVHEHA